MFGEIIFVTVAMFLVAFVICIPFGFFIYAFEKDPKQPFGEAHGVICIPFGFFIYAFEKDPKQPFGEAHGASHGMGPILAKFDPFLQKWLAPKKAS